MYVPEVEGHKLLQFLSNKNPIKNSPSEEAIAFAKE